MEYLFNTQEGEPIDFFIGSANAILSRYKGKKGFLVDVGAHIGIVSIMAVCEYNFKFAVAVEPDLANYVRLVDNILQNHCEGKVLPLWAAVSNKSYTEGTLRSNNNGVNSGCQSLKYKEGFPGTPVALLTLSDVMLNMPKIDLLKIDIEGGEFDLLYETNKVAFERAKWIDIEVHDLKPYWNTDLFQEEIKTKDNLKTYLTDCGFKLQDNEDTNGFFGPRK